MAEEIKEQAAAPVEEVVAPIEESAEDINQKVAKLETQLEQAGHVIETLKKAKKQKVEIPDEFLEESPEERTERLRGIAKEQVETILASAEETMISQQSKLIAESKTQLSELKKSLAAKQAKTQGAGGGGQKEVEEQGSYQYDPAMVSMMAKSSLFPDGQGGWTKTLKK